MYADMHLQQQQQQQQQQLWDSSSNSWRGEAAGMWLHNGVWYSQGPSQQNSIGTGIKEQFCNIDNCSVDLKFHKIVGLILNYYLDLFLHFYLEKKGQQ
jgi:hypothetical protein